MKSLLLILVIAYASVAHGSQDVVVDWNQMELSGGYRIVPDCLGQESDWPTYEGRVRISVKTDPSTNQLQSFDFFVGEKRVPLDLTREFGESAVIQFGQMRIMHPDNYGPPYVREAVLGLGAPTIYALGIYMVDSSCEWGSRWIVPVYSLETESVDIRQGCVEA